ncbi:MAG: hypothetical protein HYW71_02075, partial [Candidatus Niyogibacteria bacterium]|nr:hypothetical protein [Candidatus Niyogibacteria bacterium]
YTLCYSTQTNCGAANDPNGYHSAAPIPGSSVSIVVPAGGYADLWWHFTLLSPASVPDSVSAPSLPSPAILPFYRLYKTNIFQHFYTMNASERDDFLKIGYVLEEPAGYLYNIQQSGTSPFYRLYHPGLFNYLYTANTEERDIAQKNGYIYQGVAGYLYLTQQTNASPLYRMYSASKKQHFYTMNVLEKDNAVQNLGYTFEGIAGYMFTSQISAVAPVFFQTANALNAIQRILNEIEKILPALK